MKNIKTVSEWKAERKKKERIYYIKQKLSGIAIAMVGVIDFLMEWDITILLFFLPLGLFLIFTKEKIMMF